MHYSMSGVRFGIRLNLCKSHFLFYVSRQEMWNIVNRLLIKVLRKIPECHLHFYRPHMCNGLL